MNQSNSIGELAKALASAQASLEGAKKDNVNPHFRSRYADLASCWDAAREPLAKNGLSVVQTFDGMDEEDRMVLVSTLMHSSGEWISSKLVMPLEKMTPQGIVSASTYARRAALCGLVGISPVDDDGESAEGRGASPAAVNKPTAAARVKKKVAKKAAPKQSKTTSVSLLTDADHTIATKDLGVALRNRKMNSMMCVEIAKELGIPYSGGKPTELSVGEIRKLIKGIEDQTPPSEVPF